MEIWNQFHVVGPYVGCFALSIVSALVPWFNGEVVLLSFTVLARSRWATLWLVLLACAGQMAGKCILYWAGKGMVALKSGRMKERVLAWKERLEQSPGKMLSLVFISSAVGIPPFYGMTILAGLMGVRFGPFLTVGACGRLVRFGALALLPCIVIRWFR